MNLCQFRDIFGKPNQGVHSIRFMGIAIVDFILTVLVAFIISYLFGFNFWAILIILILSGIILHRVFCVKTAVNKVIFGDN
jgi:uncharacterized membrane protein YgaE (UPF0421/DUF939 family)